MPLKTGEEAWAKWYLLLVHVADELDKGDEDDGQSAGHRNQARHDGRHWQEENGTGVYIMQNGWECKKNKRNKRTIAQKSER